MTRSPLLLSLPALVLFAVLAASCGGPVQDINVQCIQPPISRVTTDNDTILGLAAELEQLPLDGGLELLFEGKVDLEFSRIADCEAGLHLFLNAIDCYMQRGAVGEEIAHGMAQHVHGTWIQCRELDESAESEPGRLTMYQETKIVGYPESDEVLAMLRKFGID